MYNSKKHKINKCKRVVCVPNVNNKGQVVGVGWPILVVVGK